MTDIVAGPLLEEFVARKQQILNLEVRLFVVVFLVQLTFFVSLVLLNDRVRTDRSVSAICSSVFYLFFFEMVAIHGKMGVVSMYLRQFEQYLRASGHSGVVWESRALDKIIFVPGNAFTLPAGLAIAVLLFQAWYFTHSALRPWINDAARRYIVSFATAAALCALVAKTATVDFGREWPSVFDGQSAQNP